jgi:hypothetical protein
VKAREKKKTKTDALIPEPAVFAAGSFHRGEFERGYVAVARTQPDQSPSKH